MGRWEDREDIEGKKIRGTSRIGNEVKRVGRRWGFILQKSRCLLGFIRCRWITLFPLPGSVVRIAVVESSSPRVCPRGTANLPV